MKSLAKQVMNKTLNETLASLASLETNLKKLQKAFESAIETDNEIWDILHELELTWKGKSVEGIVYRFLVSFGKELVPSSRVMRQSKKRIDEELEEIRKTIQQLKEEKAQ